MYLFGFLFDGRFWGGREIEGGEMLFYGCLFWNKSMRCYVMIVYMKVLKCVSLKGC